MAETANCAGVWGDLGCDGGEGFVDLPIQFNFVEQRKYNLSITAANLSAR